MLRPYHGPLVATLADVRVACDAANVSEFVRTFPNGLQVITDPTPSSITPPLTISSLVMPWIINHITIARIIVITDLHR